MLYLKVEDEFNGSVELYRLFEDGELISDRGLEWSSYQHLVAHPDLILDWFEYLEVLPRKRIFGVEYIEIPFFEEEYFDFVVQTVNKFCCNLPSITEVVAFMESWVPTWKFLPDLCNIRRSSFTYSGIMDPEKRTFLALLQDIEDTPEWADQAYSYDEASIICTLEFMCEEKGSDSQAANLRHQENMERMLIDAMGQEMYNGFCRYNFNSKSFDTIRTFTFEVYFK